MDKREKLEKLVEEANALIPDIKYRKAQRFGVMPRKALITRIVTLVLCMVYGCIATSDILRPPLPWGAPVDIVIIPCIFWVICICTGKEIRQCDEVYWFCTQFNIDEVEEVIKNRREEIAKETKQRSEEALYLQAIEATAEEIRELGGNLDLDVWWWRDKREAGTRRYASLSWRDNQGYWKSAVDKIFFDQNGVDEVYFQIMLRRMLLKPGLREELISQYQKTHKLG